MHRQFNLSERINIKSFLNQLDSVGSERKKTLISINGRYSEIDTDSIKEVLHDFKNTDTMDKFKKLEQEVIELKTKISVHREKLTIFKEIKDKKEELKQARINLDKTIEENKALIKSPFITELKINLTKYGKMILDKEIAFSIGFNTSDNIDFDIKVENAFGFDNSLDDGHTIKKLLCFIFACAVIETSKDKNFFKFVAFDSPFDGDKNTYQDGVYNALKELKNQGIQTIITSVEDVINNTENLAEIKSNFLVRYLTEKDKLLGDF